MNLYGESRINLIKYPRESLMGRPHRALLVIPQSYLTENLIELC